MTDAVKRCRRCGQEKPHALFHRSRSMSDGLHSWCVACYRAREAERRAADPRLVEAARARARAYARQRYAEKKQAVLDSNARYRRNREACDPLFKATSRLRSATYDAFRRGGYTKRSKATALLGCDWPEAKARIERLFQPGMTWENHGQWHIDHMRPLASARTLEDLEALCRIENLQPLWGLDNIAKGARQ